MFPRSDCKFGREGNDDSDSVDVFLDSCDAMLVAVERSFGFFCTEGFLRGGLT